MNNEVQTWVVGVCVLLALAYTVWSAVRKAKRVQAGGAACGGCSGDACGNTGSASCSTGQGGMPAQPIHWHPPTKHRSPETN